MIKEFIHRSDSCCWQASVPVAAGPIKARPCRKVGTWLLATTLKRKVSSGKISVMPSNNALAGEETQGSIIQGS